MKRVVIFIAALLACTTATSSWAAGFRLPEADSAALGMSSAFVGQADNPSAVWYNPAGITALDGTQMSGGLVGIYPAMKHETTSGSTDVSQRDFHVPVHLYGTSKMNDKMAFGVGINNPFGLSTDWNDNTSATRYVATYSKVASLEVNPNLAYKLSDSVSMAFGIAYVQLRATMEKILQLGPLGDKNFRLTGDGDGWGANAAVMYKANDKLNIGMSYRSRVKIALEGDATIDVPALGPNNPGTNTGKTEITLPDIIQIGTSYKASDKLTLNADLEYTLWSTYDRLVITSPTILRLNTALGQPQTDTQTDEKQWNDVWCLRIGGQYALSDQWKMRAGYLYDNNPVDEQHFETRTPDSDRQGLSIGLGYASGKITVDMAYLYLKFNDRTISNSQVDDDANPLTPADSLNGTYKSEAHLAGITVGYKF